MTALAIIHKQSIIEQIRAGTRLSKIAESLSIDKSAISKQLSDDPDYQEAYKDYHDARIDNAEEMILAAEDQVNIARARTYWTAVSWRAARLDKRYADKQEAGNASVTVIINQRDSQGNVIEHDG